MGRKKGKKGRAGRYCEVCQGEEHDSCSLTPGCPCCDTTIEEMARLNVAVAAEIPPLLGLKGCGREECGASSNISEDASFGTGELDDYGFWEEGCYDCARAYESRHPDEKAWPYSKDELERLQEEEHAHWREQGTQWAREQDVNAVFSRSEMFAAVEAYMAPLTNHLDVVKQSIAVNAAYSAAWAARTVRA